MKIQASYYKAIMFILLVSHSNILFCQKLDDITNLEPQFSKVREFVNVADSLFNINNYEESALLYEQMVKLNPSSLVKGF